MKRLALLLSTFAALATPQAVSAQREIDPDRIDRSQVGTRFTVELEAMEGDEMRVFLKRIGRCLARNDRDLAQKVLENSDPIRIDYDAVGMDFREIADEMNMGRCLGASMPPSARYMQINYNGTLIRGLLAEEMYLHGNDDAPVIGEGDPVSLDNRFFVGGMADPVAMSRAAYADCVVYNAPALAHEMLDANPNSKDEREAAQALAPVFEQCLGSGEPVSFTLWQMRPYIADGLWSRSHYGQDGRQAAGVAE